MSQPPEQRLIQTISQNRMAGPLQDPLHYPQEGKINTISKRFSAISVVLEEEPFAPFLWMIPNQNGTGMMIQTNHMELLNDDLFVNISEIGPASHKNSWTTMSYSETARSYSVSIIGLAPQIGVDLAVGITSTNGLQTGNDQVRRQFIPISDTPTLASIDSLFSLSFHNPETLPYDAYVALTTHFSGALPENLPEGYRRIGYVYSVNVSGSLLQADKILTLKIGYTPETLAGADPKSLTIMAWDASKSEWVDRGGQSSCGPPSENLAIETKDFTAYALVSKSIATDAWCTDFIGFDGISDADNVTIDFDSADDNDFVLILDNTNEGYVLTKDITLPNGNYVWDQVTFNSINSTETNVVVEVLNISNTVLMPDVTNGGSLASIDPIADPTIRLRVSLQSSVDGETPQVDFVRVSWQQQAPTVTPTMTATVTAANTPLPTATPMPTETNTLTPTFTNMPTFTDTLSPLPTATDTVVPMTNTSIPTDTPSPLPTSTNTVVPETNTSEPTGTPTPLPTATDTVVLATSIPVPTDTPPPLHTVTDTVIPVTNTSEPADTLLPLPIATDTVIPTITSNNLPESPQTTATPVPTPTHTPENKIFLPLIEN